jgi:hypothetical protein
MNSHLVIITPIYKKDISKDEELSIQSSLLHLKAYDKVIIAPNRFMNDDEFLMIWKNYGYKIVFFDDKHFVSTESYNRLMMNKEFYKRFEEYKYMLIYQLDVLVFSDSLDYWISKNIDYVGAPWIVEDEDGKRFQGAGNGGLSLRNIQTFIKVLESKKLFNKKDRFVRLSLNLKFGNICILWILMRYGPTRRLASLYRKLYSGQEDRFWALFATFFVKDFRVATVKESLLFAFERYPEFCFEQNGHMLPFGVHAWERYNPIFWKKYQTVASKEKEEA